MSGTLVLRAARQGQVLRCGHASALLRLPQPSGPIGGLGARRQHSASSKGMMRASVLSDYAGAKESFQAKNITVQTLALPTPQEGEVQIKVAASSVNPIDWKISSGFMRQMMPLPLPTVLGFDCSGVVAAVGPGVSRVKVGDEVWADVVDSSPGGAKLGAFAEYVVTKEKKVGLKPENLSFEEAGVVPLAGLTGLQALRSLHTQAGSTILVLGGSGATGIAAIQIAKAQGAKVFTTCSSRNMEFVKGLGADKVIDYTKDDWAELLKGKNLDGVFDSAGDKDALTRALSILKEGGRFTSIAQPVPTDPLPGGVVAQFLLTKSDSVEDLDLLRGYCESGELSIKIQRTFTLEEVPEAFQTSMGGKVVGKISIKV